MVRTNSPHETWDYQRWFFIILIYTGFLYVLYFHAQWRYQYETIPGLKSKYRSSKWSFLSWLFIPDFRIFCISMYSESINKKLHHRYMTMCTSWNWSFFYHGYIYRISVSFVFPCTVKVLIRNYTCTIRPSAHVEIDHFLSWLYIPDFRMFCISTYSEGINTKLHLD